MRLTFTEFCMKYKFWLLLIGVLTAVIYIGLVLIGFAIYGFVKSDEGSTNELQIYESEYSNDVKKNHFVKCPVCKKGKIKQDKTDTERFICDFCNAIFKKKSESDYKLILNDVDEKYKDYKFGGYILNIFEWNFIALNNMSSREKALMDIKSGKFTKFIDSNSNVPVMLKSNEKIIKTENCTLYEPRAIRNYGGSTVRIMKGWSIHSGQAESHLELRPIDNGTLVLTNQRLVFNGTLRSSNMELKKLINVTQYTDGFDVSVENRQKPQFFNVNDSELWVAFLEGVRKN